MLESLHVKNLALIDEAEVEFKKGLNLLLSDLSIWHLGPRQIRTISEPVRNMH